MVTSTVAVTANIAIAIAMIIIKRITIDNNNNKTLKNIKLIY